MAALLQSIIGFWIFNLTLYTREFAKKMTFRFLFQCAKYIYEIADQRRITQ